MSWLSLRPAIVSLPLCQQMRREHSCFRLGQSVLEGLKNLIGSSLLCSFMKVHFFAYLSHDNENPKCKQDWVQGILPSTDTSLSTFCHVHHRQHHHHHHRHHHDHDHDHHHDFHPFFQPFLHREACCASTRCFSSPSTFCVFRWYSSFQADMPAKNKAYSAKSCPKTTHSLPILPYVPHHVESNMFLSPPRFTFNPASASRRSSACLEFK